MDELEISKSKLQDLKLDLQTLIGSSNLRSCNFDFEISNSSILQSLSVLSHCNEGV
jgi:hypothetical protein